MNNEPAKPSVTPSPSHPPTPASTAPAAAGIAAAAAGGVPAVPTPAAASAPAMIAFDAFTKIDLRIATITKAEIHPNADKLLKLRVDDGTPEGRQICAGIRQWYDPATLVGRQVVIVANLEPKTIRGEISQGMVLAASDLRVDAVTGAAGTPGGERDVVILAVERPVKAGSKVS